MALRGPHRRPRTRLLPEDPPSRRSPSSRALPEKSPRMPVERSLGRDAVSRHGPPVSVGIRRGDFSPALDAPSTQRRPRVRLAGNGNRPYHPSCRRKPVSIPRPPELRPRTAPHSIGRANCSGCYAVITMRGRRLAMIESIIDAKDRPRYPRPCGRPSPCSPANRVRYFIHQDGHVRITGGAP